MPSTTIATYGELTSEHQLVSSSQKGEGEGGGGGRGCAHMGARFRIGSAFHNVEWVNVLDLIQLWHIHIYIL